MPARSTSTIDRGDTVSALALIDHFVLGGAETLLARFALSAHQAGIDLHVACLGELDGNPAAAPLIAAGRPPVNLGLKGRPSLQGLLAVRQLIRAVRPQVVHTHLGGADLLGSVAARSLGIPAISTIHSTLWPGMKALVWRRIVDTCASRVVAVSDSARREYLARGLGSERQVVTIHNGIDVPAAPGAGLAVREELGLNPDDQVAIMVSALREEKGHDVALEAVRRLAADFPRLRLVIVGQGLLAGPIAAAAERMDGRVVLTGLRPDVMQVLDAADVCLQPSRREAFPTSLIEAMAAGLPVIATDTGGIPEIVTPGKTGILIPAPPDAGRLAGALAEVLADDDRRRVLGAAGRVQYERCLTAGPWVRRTRALYDEVIAERAARRGGLPHLGRAAGRVTPSHE